MVAIDILIAILIPVFLGMSLLHRLGINKGYPYSLTIPIAFGIGFGLLTHWMLLLSIMNLSFSRWIIGGPLLMAAATLFITKQKTKLLTDNTFKNKQIPSDNTNTHLQILFTIYITYIFVFVVVRGIMVPVLEWDAISFIALKGKIFFYEKSIYKIAELPNSAYPLHVPLAMSWIALNLREWNETLVKIIFPLYFLAFGLFYYQILKLYVNRLWAKGSLALLLSANFLSFHATIAYSDIIMMFYFSGGILLILWWMKLKDRALLTVITLFFGIATFVKLEGAVYMIIGLIMLWTAYLKTESFADRRLSCRVISYGLISIGLFLVYYLYKMAMGASSYNQDLHLTPIAMIPAKIIGLGKTFFCKLFLSANWHILWALFLISLLQVNKVVKCAQSQILAGTIGLFFLFYILAGIFTGLDSSLVGLGTSSVLSRVLLHVYPLAIFFITIINAREPLIKK